MDKWISVKERLPEESEVVLCYCPVVVRIGYLLKEKWYRFHNGGDLDPQFFAGVTHWMELPSPPKQ